MTTRGTPYEGVGPAGVGPADVGPAGVGPAGSRPAGNSSAGTAPRDGERRVALVIGNGAYRHASKLDNPVNDATAMAARFKQLGFEVFTGLDMDYRDLGKLAVEFEKSIRGIDVALFYYAGHGLQVHGKNYLVPVDAEIAEVGELKFNTVLFDDVLEPMTRLSKTALVFLDACRDNPFARNIARSLGQRSVSGGLAEIKSDDGSFIAFATAPDRVAFDGHGGNSPFTNAMLAHVGTPGLSLSDMMVDVRNAVRDATKGKQVPWEHSSLFSKFYFVPEEAAPAQPAPLQAMSAAAEEWASVQNTTSLATLALFKERYPEPPWGEYADIRAGELRLADKQRREVEQLAAEQRHPERRDNEQRHAATAAAVTAKSEVAENKQAQTDKLAAMAAAISKTTTGPAPPTAIPQKAKPLERAEPLTAGTNAALSSRQHEDQFQTGQTKPVPFVGEKAERASRWSKLWLGVVIIGIWVCMASFLVMKISWFGWDGLITGAFVGAAISLISAAWLASRRRLHASGSELAIYWYGSAYAIGFVCFVIFPGHNLGWFGLSSGQTGLVVGQSFNVVSATWLARRNWLQASGSQLAIYWLGGSNAALMVCGAIFDSMNFVWFGMGSTRAGLAIGSVFVVVSAVQLTWRRWRQASGSELAIYWFGGANAGFLVCVLLFEGLTWFDLPKPLTAICIGLVLAIVSGISLMILRRKRRQPG